jgi:hypothetical protein
MFGCLVLLDLSVWLPGTALVAEPMAGLALSAAVAAAARDVATSRRAAPAAGVTGAANRADLPR